MSSAPVGADARPAAPQVEQATHALTVETLLKRLEADPRDGLTPEEAAARLASNGPNRLPVGAKDPAWRRFLAQFQDPLVLTLLAAAAVATVVAVAGEEAAGSSFLARFADALAILLIVFLNAIIGFYQEARAEAALDALNKLAAPRARVRRGGQLAEVDAETLVVGDLVELETGDAVAADCRLLHAIDFATEESALTGESVPSVKDAMAEVPVDSALGDRETMIYTGTTVVRGRGRAIVASVGADTELGRIGQMIASIADQKTPLEKRLDRFGKIILWVCVGLSLVLMAWGFARPALLGGQARPWHVLLLEAVALAVAAIPEGLPAITTITLALGMQRMARRGAIVRKLPAVETLGAATIICSDKTGTLTKNEMTVRQVYAGGRHYAISGEGYDPGGEISDEDGESVHGADLPEPLERLLSTAALCNNAKLEQQDGLWQVIGDPTEGALLTLAAKGDILPESVRGDNVTVAELPFDSDRKRMTVVTRDRHGRMVAHVKGAPATLLERSDCYLTDRGPQPLSAEIRAQITEAGEAMSRQAMRVLALCRREEVPGHHDPDVLETHLTFLGLVAMLDPPRTGVLEAVETCHRAGIRPVMITGDHKLTAQAIAEEIGMWEPGDRAMTGAELDKLDEAQLASDIMSLRVFARTTPEQKLRIVRAFKKAGHVVAMTGDGVNDAPALRESDIGVAMGRGGTDVARQAAEMVLSDDNFATIVHAIQEGRAIYRNIKKFIFFLLSANMGLVVAVFTVSFFASWPPLTPLMVLWINLVTNGAPALALGVDPADKHLMEEPPRPVNEGLMVFRDYLGILFVGGVMGAAAVALYLLAPQDTPGLERARALCFTVLAISPLIHAHSCRSPIRSAFASRPIFSLPLIIAVALSGLIHLAAVFVPTLQPVFKTFAPTESEWLQVLLLAALVLPMVELTKWFNRRRLRSLDMAPPSSVAATRR